MSREVRARWFYDEMTVDERREMARIVAAAYPGQGFLKIGHNVYTFIYDLPVDKFLDFRALAKLSVLVGADA